MKRTLLWITLSLCAGDAASATSCATSGDREVCREDGDSDEMAAAQWRLGLSSKGRSKLSFTQGSHIKRSRDNGHEQCLAVQGNNHPSQPYEWEVQDPKACACTEWNPDNGDLQASWQHCSKHHVIEGAPWGLVFFGMSLSQRAPDVPTANQASVTHQTKFDLNRLQDRANQYLCKTSDDGWLAGGGNSPSSFLLPHIDSAHMEFIHPGSICASLAAKSEVQPNTASYPANPAFITGAPLAVLIERVRRKVAFDPIRVVPTEAQFTGTDEYQLRFNPKYQDDQAMANPSMLDVYNRLVNEFLDVQVLDKSDPFHASMCRETKFCSNRSRTEFFENNEKLTIGPWREWASDITKQDGRLGTLLNDDIPRYKDKAGGFYLFVSRNRPLIYFAPKPLGQHARGSLAYYCEWRQDGRIVDFANPLGGPVFERLVPIPCSTPAAVFVRRTATLRHMSSQLCSSYSYHAMPTTAWTPPK